MCNTVDIADHVVVPESQNSEVLLAQVSVARSIHPLTGSRIMLTSINLNNDPRGVTGEVDDEVIDRHLSTEMEATRFQRAKKSPKFSFGVG
jgi:hypothetical protein